MIDCQFNVLKGKTLSAVEYNGEDVIRFIVDNTESYTMYHEQDCCEHVSVEDICGDLNDLVGSEIINAELACDSGYDDSIASSDNDSYTWSFYKIDTRKDGVTIRWYGASNGYYSEKVNFCRSDVDHVCH